MKKLLCLFLVAIASLQFQNTARADDIVETASKAGKFKTLIAAVKAAGLLDTLSGHSKLTVFAPTDEAFAKLPKGTLQKLLKPENKSLLIQILTFHVVPGQVRARDAFQLDYAPTVNGQRLDLTRSKGQLKINGAGLVATDISCDNGIIHVIDTVMLPEQSSIPSVAKKAGQFNTLLAAVGKAKLAAVLGSDGPFTVFAPTDEAFSKLPKGTVESLLKPENRSQLAAILKYHVVAGRVFSDQAIKLEKAKTLQGKSVSIAVSAEGAKINDARLVATDIEASNGVIHVIDSVLLPPMLSRSDARTALESAVKQGSRQFNGGNERSCAKTYRAAMNSIIEDGGSDISDTTKEILRLSIARASQVHDAREACWLLRHGIDLAYFALEKSNHKTMTSKR